MSLSFSLINKTRIKANKYQLKKIKEMVLGKVYDLSLVFLQEKEMERLHKIWLKKSGATTVISFPLSEKTGEIFLCPSHIKKESKKYKITFSDYFKKIFTHGLLHLKGMRHGKKMEQEEEKILKNNLIQS